MKDLEKIKSEDLGCQVQDANPGNFAIEQEVAQLVGATVPAPTEPSADDARELGAQLLVFLRRALTPIQTALRTAVAAIYAHLDSRCTDYTPAGYAPYQPRPYDPMGTPPTPRSVANILTAITAFSARKISNGSAPSDGIPDGTSLAHLLCDTSAANAVTEICDDNYGWTMNKALTSAFPNITKVTLNCKKLLLDNGVRFTTLPLDELNFPEMEEMSVGTSTATQGVFMGLHCKTLHFPKMRYMHNKGNYAGVAYYGNITQCPELEEIIIGDEVDDLRISPEGTYTDCLVTGGGGTLPKLRYIYINATYIGNVRQWFTPHIINSVPARIVRFGKLTYLTNGIISGSCPNIIHMEVGEGTSCNLPFNNWNPTMALRTDTDAEDYVDLREDMSLSNNLQQFLVNFKNYIALRLTANGTGLTLTLSQAVFSAVIEGSSPICDDIKGIIEDKGWKVQDTNNNIFPTT